MRAFLTIVVAVLASCGLVSAETLLPSPFENVQEPVKPGQRIRLLDGISSQHRGTLDSIVSGHSYEPLMGLRGLDKALATAFVQQHQKTTRIWCADGVSGWNATKAAVMNDTRLETTWMAATSQIGHRMRHESTM